MDYIEHIYLAPVLTFFAVILIYAGIAAAMKESKEQVSLRLQKYTRTSRQEDSQGGDRDQKEKGEGKARQLFKLFSRWVAPKGWIVKAEAELAQGDIPLRPEEYVALRIVLVAFVALLLNSLGHGLLLNSLAVVATALLPPLLLKRAKEKRKDRFNNQLGEGLTVMANSLRAGLSFLQAVDTLSKEMPAPLCTEFGRLLKEINLGMATEDALDNLLKRVGSDDLDLLITAVKIQRQVGGNLAEILDKIGDTIRQRIKLNGDLKTLTAQGRISGIIIGLLPLFIVGIILAINPSYMEGFFLHPIGMALIAWALCSKIIGFLLIKKIVTIDF